jgi:hypothetical protein
MITLVLVVAAAFLTSAARAGSLVANFSVSEADTIDIFESGGEVSECEDSATLTSFGALNLRCEGDLGFAFIAGYLGPISGSLEFRVHTDVSEITEPETAELIGWASSAGQIGGNVRLTQTYFFPGPVGAHREVHLRALGYTVDGHVNWTVLFDGVDVTQLIPDLNENTLLDVEAGKLHRIELTAELVTYGSLGNGSYGSFSYDFGELVPTPDVPEPAYMAPIAVVLIVALWWQRRFCAVITRKCKVPRGN